MAELGLDFRTVSRPRGWFWMVVGVGVSLLIWSFWTDASRGTEKPPQLS